MIININGDKNEIKSKLLFKLNVLPLNLTLFDFLESHKDLEKSNFNAKFVPVIDTKNIFDLIKNEINVHNPNYIILNNADYLSHDPISTINFFESLKEIINKTVLFIISNESLVIGSANVSYIRLRNEEEIDEISSIISNVIQFQK